MPCSRSFLLAPQSFCSIFVSVLFLTTATTCFPKHNNNRHTHSHTPEFLRDANTLASLLTVPPSSFVLRRCSSSSTLASFGVCVGAGVAAGIAAGGAANVSVTATRRVPWRRQRRRRQQPQQMKKFLLESRTRRHASFSLK